MTNLGFRLAMEQAGISVIETAVGDRYVLEALDEGGLLDSAGSSAGHIIFRDVATTGDGMLTAMQCSRSGAPLRPNARRSGGRGR